MQEVLYLCPTPTEEECAQLGAPGYAERAKNEIAAFIDQIERTFKTDKVRLKMVREKHDFGMYYDLVVRYNDSDPESIEQAFEIENNLPEKWDETAIEFYHKIY
jgi:hypothetical protein